MTIPGERAVTTPLLVTEATDGFELDHTPWLDGDMLTVAPIQAKSGPDNVGVDGIDSINTPEDAAEVQPS